MFSKERQHLLATFVLKVYNGEELTDAEERKFEELLMQKQYFNGLVEDPYRLKRLKERCLSLLKTAKNEIVRVLRAH